MVIEGSRLILTSSVKFSPLSLSFLYSKGIAEVRRTGLGTKLEMSHIERRGILPSLSMSASGNKEVETLEMCFKQPLGR